MEIVKEITKKVQLSALNIKPIIMRISKLNSKIKSNKSYIR